MAQTSGWHHPSFSQLQIDRRSDFTLHFLRDKLNTPRGPQSLARWKGEGRVDGEGRGGGEVSTLCPSGYKVLVLFSCLLKVCYWQLPLGREKTSNILAMLSDSVVFQSETNKNALGSLLW